MKKALLAGALLASCLWPSQAILRLIEVDPGHFHAAELHQTALSGFSREVHVYAPLGPDLTAHLETITSFNNRPIDPTHWTLRVYAGDDFLDQMLHEPSGNVVVLSGRNDRKINYLLAAVKAGQNVLADKPWIIEANDLPKLEQALNQSEQKGLIAYDCMTQRFDPAYQIQRELLRDRAVFGEPLQGTPADPAVKLENLHAILKTTNGHVLRRPPWFFDVHEQGEGIADVGTHLVDLVEWSLFPDQAVERQDARVLRASHSSIPLTAAQFERVSGEAVWPRYLESQVRNGALQFYARDKALFTLRGIHVALSVAWQYEAAPGVKDSYLASYQGSLSRVELRQGVAEKFIAEINVVPRTAADRGAVAAALRNRLNALQPGFPGLGLRRDERPLSHSHSADCARAGRPIFQAVGRPLYRLHPFTTVSTEVGKSKHDHEILHHHHGRSYGSGRK